jgi:hypothetical protein
MWLNMLGLGNIAATVNDPGFQDQIRAFAAAQFETLETVRRLDRKLDKLLDVAGIANDERFNVAGGATALLAGDRPAGTGLDSVAGGIADNGNGEPASAPPPHRSRHHRGAA